jgi:dTDP-4-amino-4,6-dideoxygalactose transaminase
MSRLYLSPPHMGDDERRLLLEAFDSNWIAPLGPHVDAFERELGTVTGMPHVAALSSGTSAIHLALVILGVQPGDEVIVSSFTFAATANAVRYVGAVPVFIDSDEATWNMDPALLREELKDAAKRGKMPKAIIPVDLYGQCADYDPILETAAAHGVPVVEDAAEALGATYKGKPAGQFGVMSALSFNGNKIITTSGGGALLSRDAALVARTRFLATQARDTAPHYEHSEIGYNYRLSNLLAAVGRGQLRTLRERVAARRRNFDFYTRAFSDLPGISMMPEAPYGEGTHWLTCIVVNAGEFGASHEDIRLALEREDIEARPLWKPMHLQPVFRDCRVRGGSVSANLFARGLCLPSGSGMSDADLERVAAIVRSQCRTAPVTA